MFRPSCDSIIFDLDGTLWDASPTSASAWSKTAVDLGLNVSLDETDIKKVSGLPFDQCVDILFGHHAQKIPDLGVHLDSAEQKEIMEHGGRFYSGMLEGIRQLSQEHKLFLVSNCQDWYLKAFFKHSGLQSCFEDSVCHGHTGLSKTENIKSIIKRNDLKKAIYVGDTHWDQEAAFFSGAKFIFARYGFGKVNVSCPTVSSIGELVALMTAPAGTPQIDIKKLSRSDFEMAERFYRSVGYVQALRESDWYYCAFHQDTLIGVVRLAFEEGHWVLRGMQIKPEFQFFGVGTQLIRRLQQDLSGRQCFCIPHGWLEGFYGQIGFKAVGSLESIPSFLADRFKENKKKYPRLILMMREAE